MIFNFKEQAKRNKDKIIKKESIKLEKYCVRQLKNYIKSGLDFAEIYFNSTEINKTFFDEIVNQTLENIKEKHKGLKANLVYDIFKKDRITGMRIEIK